MANILVIDQTKQQRSELLHLFSELGHVPTEAWDGSNAAHKADQITYDMIVCSMDITKVTIEHFVKSLRTGKTNRKTPVILYAENFTEESVAALSKLGKIQFVKSPIDSKALAEKVNSTFKAAEAVNREQEAQKKVYTFSKASLEKCTKVSVEKIEQEFFRFFPDMLQQIDPATVDFGIWLKGSHDLLEYVSPKFSGVENAQNIEGIVAALKRVNGGLELYLRISEKDKLYSHIQKRRLARLSTKSMTDSQKETAELFNKLTVCATRFNAADIDQNVIASAEQISMDMMQRVSDKPELMTLIVDLLRKDVQMFDFLALVTITSVSLGKKLGLKDVSLKKLSLGCFFHDVGLATLNLPLIIDREMTSDEMMLYREHPSAGIEYLNSMEIKGVILPEEVFIIMMQHHEKFNGTGFPNQKAGRASKENPTGIHLMASIVSVADRFALYLLNESKNGIVDQNRIITAMHRLTGEFDPIILQALRDVFAISRQGTVNWKAS